jgi:hypothetical protein
MQMCERVSVYGLSLAESRWTTEMKAAGTTYHYFKHWVDSEQLRAHPHHRYPTIRQASQSAVLLTGQINWTLSERETVVELPWAVRSFLLEGKLVEQLDRDDGRIWLCGGSQSRLTTSAHTPNLPCPNLNPNRTPSFAPPAQSLA